MSMASLQTTIARQVALLSDQKLNGHRRGCHTCHMARIDADYCPDGWELAKAARADRVTARASAELDKQVPDGQDTLL